MCFLTGCKYRAAKKQPFILWGYIQTSALNFTSVSHNNIISNTGCETHYLCYLSAKRCLTNESKVLQTSWARFVVAALSSHLCERASNCPTDVLKYIWNQLLYCSSMSSQLCRSLVVPCQNYFSVVSVQKSHWP